jgi:hypothetical protein
VILLAKKTLLKILNRSKYHKNKDFQSQRNLKDQLADKASAASAKYANIASQLQKEVGQVSDQIYALRKQQSGKNKEVYRDTSSAFPYSALMQWTPGTS